MKLDTIVVHAGQSPDPSTGAIITPIYQTATYTLEEVGKNRGFDYSRSSNPNRRDLENKLAAIEGASYGVSFASGMSAVDSVIRLLSSGDHIVAVDDVYGGVSRLLNEVAICFGITVSYVDFSDPEKVISAVTPHTKLLWVETPTNPLLKIIDLRLVTKIARERDLLTVVDSTFATPYILRPIEWGADIVVHSTTKYLSGHNQVIGGACVTNHEPLYKKLKFIQKSVGAVSSPFDCWLTLLGIRSLCLRMERHSTNAMAVATYLESHPKVEKVIYPGLSSHPQHEVAKKLLSSFGGMISFTLRGNYEESLVFLKRLRLCALAESLGSVESMVTHPASMTHADVPRAERLARGLSDGLIRLSVGIEAANDIIGDLEQALD